MNLRMTPIDLDRDGNPRDGKLCAAMQVYAEKEFGHQLSVIFYRRLWVVEAWKEEDPEFSVVMGIAALRETMDCQIFHVTAPTADRDGVRLAHQARDLMVFRLHSYLSDIGLRGAQVLIYVSEQAERLWAHFFQKSKITKANRYSIQI